MSSPTILDAVRNNDHEGIKTMLAKGMDVDEGWPFYSPLGLACELGHEECVRILLRHNALLDKEDEEGMTPLMYACQNEHPGCVELMLRAGADRDIVNDEGKTARDMCNGGRGESMCWQLLEVDDWDE